MKNKILIITANYYKSISKNLYDCAKKTLTCLKISAFTTYFGNSDYGWLKPNRLDPVPFFWKSWKILTGFLPSLQFSWKNNKITKLYLTYFSHIMLFIPNYFSSDSDSHLDQQIEMLSSFNKHVPCNPQGEYAKNNFKSILKSLKTT